MTILVPQNSRLRFPIGISNYRQLRQENYLFVDKTAFIAQVIENDNPTMLIPRPRQFGKTLNLTMLKYFFEMKEKSEENEGINIIERTKRKIVNDRTFNKVAKMFSQSTEQTKSQKKKIQSDIFEDTAIWTAKNGSYQEHFQQYPVVFLRFTCVKALKWSSLWYSLRGRLRLELKRLQQKYDLFNPSLQNVFDSQKRAKLFDYKQDPAVFKNLLGNIILALHQITGKKVIVIIDEYDAPILSAERNDYWKDAVDFFKPFFSNGLNQEFLFKAVIIGIFNVVKESIFSGINNLDVYTVISHKFRADFGFTEDEVRELAELMNKTQNLDDIKRWYNGYRFGDALLSQNSSNKTDKIVNIYNPWSVLKHLGNNEQYLEAHWLGTSENALIKELLVGKVVEYEEKINSLIKHESISIQIYQNIELQTIRQNINAVWSLLLFSGYLAVEKTERIGNETYYHVCIPNVEAHIMFTDVFKELLFQSSIKYGFFW